MAGTQKKVRFILAWQNYKVGAEITPNGVLRDWLIANGYVELVDKPALLPEKKGAVTDKAKAAAQAKGGLFTR